jgi:hypothetical protein
MSEVAATDAALLALGNSRSQDRQVQGNPRVPDEDLTADPTKDPERHPTRNTNMR